MGGRQQRVEDGAFQQGSAFDRYVIDGILGSGGMGSVYRAFDTRLRRAVALKILTRGDEDEAVVAALREARACAAIHHPGVAAVFDVGNVGGTAYIVMELVPGASLRRLVGDASADVATRVRWLVDVALALAYTHERGIIHRDVKPENVIVRDDGAIKVLDFGVARLPPREGAPAGEHTTLSVGGALLGTPAYMAPEQARGHEIDGRADQFAWGVMAYELLVGAVPWQRAGGPLGVLRAMLTDPPAPFPPAAGVPDGVAAVVMRALEKAREDRFPSMTEVADALTPHAAPPAPFSSPGEPREAVEGRATLPRSDRLASSPTPPISADRLARPASLHPSSRPPSSPPVVSTTLGSSRFRDPDFSAPVDLDAHLALLPVDATGKGMLFHSLIDLGSRVMSTRELFALAGVKERRYFAFGDYPMRDNLSLAVAVARSVHERAPLGEGLRRVGQSAFDAVLGSRIGKITFGVFGADVEQIFTYGHRAYGMVHNFGEFSGEKVGPGAFLFHLRRFPSFLDTCQIGVIEGALRHTRAAGRVRIRSETLADATLEITLL